MSEQVIKEIRKCVASSDYHNNRNSILKWKEEYWETFNVLSQIANFFVQHSQNCEKCNQDILEKDYEEGRYIYQRVLELNPKSQPALLFFAKEWYGKPGLEFQKAIERIIHLTGEKGCYTYLGHHYQAQGDYEKAKSYFLKAEPHINDHYGIYYSLAKLSDLQGNKMECVMWAEKALEIFSGMTDKYKEDPITKQFIDELKGWVSE
jgi:tetratricopeptide (TPR) repeat protein